MSVQRLYAAIVSSVLFFLPFVFLFLFDSFLFIYLFFSILSYFVVPIRIRTSKLPIKQHNQLKRDQLLFKDEFNLISVVMKKFLFLPYTLGILFLVFLYSNVTFFYYLKFKKKQPPFNKHFCLMTIGIYFLLFLLLKHLINIVHLSSFSIGFN